jgi:hypothetical protein
MIPGLFEDIFGWRLFGYISFRMAMAGLTAFAFALAAGGPTIRWLARHRVGEDVSKTDSPELAEHAQRVGKRDTPTMGGSFLVAALLGSVLLWGRLDNLHVVLAILVTAGFAAVGFVDDFKKLTIPKSKGLSVRSKMLGLSVVSLSALVAVAWYAQASGRGALMAIYPPFLKSSAIDLASFGLLGVFAFLFFEWLVVVGTSNACNITDGLDGLAARLRGGRRGAARNGGRLRGLRRRRGGPDLRRAAPPGRCHPGRAGDRSHKWRADAGERHHGRARRRLRPGRGGAGQCDLGRAWLLRDARHSHARRAAARRA